MTQQPSEPDQGHGPRRLTRSRDDRIVAGVAGGLGRHFDVDPIIFRIGFAIAALLGGIGLLAYLAAVLLVPVEGEPEPDSSKRTWAVAAAVGLLLVWLIVVSADVTVGPFWFDPFGLFWLLALAAVVVVAWRVLDRRRDGEPSDGADLLRRLAIVLGMIILLSVAAIGAAWGTAVGGGEIVAGLVIATGILLVISAFLGGAAWLALPALALAIPAGIVSAAGVEIRGGIGEEVHEPRTVADLRDEYRLAVGHLRLDLRDIDFPRGATTVDAQVGVGRLDVIAPQGTCVVVRSQAGLGEVVAFGRHRGGVDVELRSGHAASPAIRQVVLDADVGAGQVQIVDDPADFDRSDRRGGFWRGDGGELRRRGGDPCEEGA